MFAANLGAVVAAAPAGPAAPSTWTFAIDAAGPYAGFPNPPSRAVMRNSTYATKASCYASSGDGGSGDNWIAADFTGDRTLSNVFIAPIEDTPNINEGWDETYLNGINPGEGAYLQYATAAAPSTWIDICQLSGHVVGVKKTYNIAAILGSSVVCRYVRIWIPLDGVTSAGYIGLGDFDFN